MLAVGLTARRVAARLVIQPETADHHLQRIRGKTGVSTRDAAALLARASER